ncbi:response regulator transcription factor [Coleofasciculus sp. FACHB-1120]|uniref:winged helix-turn-helix domain-containing protein n=1 Tax=Coleofasciculus sp. FACHB-1120 TaxID=2692783 RepID=UPI0016862009|nr:response regulator transcription factor [Coleofasciculus sp. FACHB-1120]MBD2742409.1 response regulator transcription factor [Coleofasciculus sp. FACHB-1120]
MNAKKLSKKKPFPPELYYSEIQQQALEMRQKAVAMRQESLRMRLRTASMREDLRKIQQNYRIARQQELQKRQNPAPHLAPRTQPLMYQTTSTWLSVLEWGSLCFNPATFEATYASQPLDLTAKECRLLELFLQKGRCILTRDEILERLWQPEETPQEETVKAHIKHLRWKLQASGAPVDLIETVYGVGYRLKNNPS